MQNKVVADYSKNYPKNKTSKNLLPNLMLAVIFKTFMAISCTFQVLPGDIKTTTSTVKDAGDDLNIDTESFEKLFSNSELHDITVEIAEADWHKLSTSLDKIKYSANLIINGQTYSNVGIRVRGNALPVQNDIYHKADFSLDFNEFNPDFKLYGLLNGLNLRSPYLQKDNSGVKELIIKKMFTEADIYSPRTGVTKLSIKIGDQTIKYGLYIISEPIDKQLLKRYLGKDANDGNLYKCENYKSIITKGEYPAVLTPESINNDFAFSLNYILQTDLEDSNDPEHNNLKTFINQLNELSGNDLKDYLDNNFDIDMFLRSLAMETLIGAQENYWSSGDNYYLYKNNQTGQWLYIPGNFDESLGDDNLLFDTINADIFNYPNANNGISHPLADKILEIPEYKELYKYYLSEFMKSTFKFIRFQEIYTEIEEKLAEAFNEDTLEKTTAVSSAYAKFFFYAKTNSVFQQLKDAGMNIAAEDYELESQE